MIVRGNYKCDDTILVDIVSRLNTNKSVSILIARGDHQEYNFHKVSILVAGLNQMIRYQTDTDFQLSIEIIKQ